LSALSAFFSRTDVQKSITASYCDPVAAFFSIGFTVSAELPRPQYSAISKKKVLYVQRFSIYAVCTVGLYRSWCGGDVRSDECHQVTMIPVHYDSIGVSKYNIDSS